MKNKKTQIKPLFVIPMVWNGFCLFVSLVVGITFLIASQMPVGTTPELPGIILFFFTLFDLLLMISPLMLVVMVLISIFNLMRETSNFRRWAPLIFSAIMQGLLSALFVASITQPVG